MNGLSTDTTYDIEDKATAPQKLGHSSFLNCQLYQFCTDEKVDVMLIIGESELLIFAINSFARIDEFINDALGCLFAKV